MFVPKIRGGGRARVENNFFKRKIKIKKEL